MTGLVIRVAVPDDAPAIAHLHIRTWQVAYAGIMPAEVLDGLSMDERVPVMREWLADPSPVFTWMLAVDPSGAGADGPHASGDGPHATADGQLVGFVSYGPYRIDQDHTRLDDSIGEILALYVDPARWGRGAGRALLDAAVRRLTDAGRHEIRLWVLEDNLPSRRFYQRYGFVADGARTLYRPAGTTGTALAGLRYTLRA